MTAVNSARSASRSTLLLDRIDYRLAETAVEREAIYRLRYRAYLNEGAIEPNSSGLTCDRYDDAPNTFVFGVHLDGDLVSSIRVSVGSRLHPATPSVDVFSAILKPEIERGKIIVDPTRFVADPELAGRYPELAYLTVRLGYLACGYFDADLGLATVRAEHRAFYRRVFLQEAICEPQTFPGLLKPVGIMAADYRLTRDRVFERFPFMRSSHFERRMLFGGRETISVGRRLSPLAEIVSAA